MTITTQAPAGQTAPRNDNDQAIGGLLVAAGKLKQSDIERVLKHQSEHKLRFGEAALRLNLVKEQDIQKALAQQFQYPYAQGAALDKRLVAAHSPFDETSEALRTLRAQLMLQWFVSGRKMLAVCSTSEREEPELLAANLAVQIAQLGKRVLLVDANLRKPTLHTLFKLPNSAGLSELLAGRVNNINPAPVPPFSTLSLLPAGSPPPNPSELLLRSSMDFLIEEAAAQFDIVLVNTPPAAGSMDYLVLVARIGGAIVSVKRNKTRFAALSDLKARISSSGASLVGAVLLT